MIIPLVAQNACRIRAIEIVLVNVVKAVIIPLVAQNARRIRATEIVFGCLVGNPALPV
jgi:hypothetical protein